MKEGAMTTKEELRQRAIEAGADHDALDVLLATAPAAWWQAPVDALLSDVLLLLPGLTPGQVRVRIASPQIGENIWELTVVAPDRQGVLATTAFVCSHHQLSIRSARVASWPGLALQRLSIVPIVIPSSGEPDWIPFGQELRTALTSTNPTEVLAGGSGGSGGSGKAEPRFFVQSVEALSDGTHRVEVSGPDEVGLLAEITRALMAAGADIRAAELSDADGQARDVFVVTGLEPEKLPVLATA
jgi:UTP:GlnB (protein PII) uridylyltransferase